MPTIEVGGVEKNFFIISNFLSKKFSNISVITFSNLAKKGLSKKINIIKPKIYCPKILGRRFKFITCLFYLLIEIIKNKNSTVFCFQGIVYCITLCKILSTNVIVRSNSSPSGWSKHSIKKIFYKKIYSMANIIIVNSLAFKKELKEKFNLNSICIYNPLNKNEILKYSKVKTKFPFFKKNNLNIINISRFTDQKDHECLVKSINLLKNKLKIKVLLIGSGPLQNKIINLTKKFKLTQNIKFINFKKNPFPYIKKSDVLILSSRYEGSPNVLLEAIALNKFVISSNCPTGPGEILDNGKGGILFPIGDYKSLAKKIELFAKNQNKFLNKKKYAKRRLERFNYKNRLNDYFKTINGL